MPREIQLVLVTTVTLLLLLYFTILILVRVQKLGKVLWLQFSVFLHSAFVSVPLPPLTGVSDLPSQFLPSLKDYCALFPFALLPFATTYTLRINVLSTFKVNRKKAERQNIREAFMSIRLLIIEEPKSTYCLANGEES